MSFPDIRINQKSKVLGNEPLAIWGRYRSTEISINDIKWFEVIPLFTCMMITKVRKAVFRAPLLAIVLLGSCDDKTDDDHTDIKPTTSDTKTPVADGGASSQGEERSWNDTTKITEGLQSARDMAAKYSESLRQKLSDSEIQKLSEYASALSVAMKDNDFENAQLMADKLGAALKSESIGEVTRILRIKTEKGTDAARHEIQRYLDNTNLSLKEIKVFTELRDDLASTTPEEWIGIVVFVTSIACESKLGHGGGGIGILLGSVLMAAYEMHTGDQSSDEQPATGVESSP